jgi:hypothetical protein
MIRSMFRRISNAVAILCAVSSCLMASAAQAASLPAQADVRAGRCIEAAAFRTLVASRYHVEFKHVIATDIDRDGDIDVVATTDRTFTVWLNDGTGHLTSQRPSHGSGVEARPSRSSWRGHDDPDEPLSNDGSAPTVPLLVPQANGPPSLCSIAAVDRDDLARRFQHARSSSPRAPPAL